MANVLSFEAIKSIGSESGLVCLGALSGAEVKSSLAKGSEALAKWQSAGFAGSMGYMMRDHKLYSGTSHIIPELVSSVVMAVPYHSVLAVDEGQRNQRLLTPAKGFGAVARYAWGPDYHEVLREALKEFVQAVIREHSFVDVSVRVFSDSVPVLERALAEEAGLGFIGKSTMLIRPGVGTYFFICEVLWDVSITDIPAKVSSKKFSCGKCASCINSCPTGAILPDFKLDARKCISYLTIEKRGVLTQEEMPMIGSWIFGCDICQEVCPFNHPGNSHEVYRGFRGLNDLSSGIELSVILKMRNPVDFSKRFKRTALSRAKRDGIIRNALCVMYNQKALELLPLVVECFTHDTSDVIRGQAKLVLQKLRAETDGLEKRKIDKVLGNVE